MADHRDQNSMSHRGNKRCLDRFYQLGIAGKAPHALVQTESPEYEDADDGIPGDKMGVGFEVHIGDHGILKIKASPQSEEIRQVNGNDVIHHQKHCQKMLQHDVF